MALDWLVGQVAARLLTKRPDDQRLPTACKAASHLPLLGILRAENAAHAFFLRVLCSGRGFGWNRAWLLRRRNGLYRCVGCVGGIEQEEWESAARHATSLGTLLEELAFACAFADSSRDTLGTLFWGSDLAALSKIIDGELALRRVDSGGQLGVPVPMDFGAKGQWNNELQQAAERMDKRYVDDTTLYIARLDEDGVVVLSDECYRRREGSSGTPVLETASWLAVAGLMLPTEMDSEAETELSQGEKIEESLSRQLRWLNIDVVSRSDFLREKVRQLRRRFESDEEYRETTVRRLVKRSE
jgi:hypothetical protein